MKVKLLYLPGAWSSWWRGTFPVPYLPYGMGVIASALRKSGHYVEQEDLLVKVKRRRKSWRIDPAILTDDACAVRCLSRGIDDPVLNALSEQIMEGSSFCGFEAIGFSILSYGQFLFALLIAEKIKQFTDAAVVFGGAFISLQGELFFDKYDFIDYMIQGDGKGAFLKLLYFLQNGGSPQNIPGLWYREQGGVKNNQREHSLIEDMPLPDFNGLPLDAYRRSRRDIPGTLILPYQISRGCPNRCSFCVEGDSPAVQTKTTEKVIDELRQYSRQYGSNYFGFCDWTINSTYEHMDRLCNAIIKNKLDISWDGWARVDCVDRKLLMKMKKAGCVALRYGIESGSSRVLALMRKGFTPQRAQQTLLYSHDAGIKSFISLIVGFPHEDRDSVQETVNFIRDNAQYICGIVSLNIFLLEPNTPIFKEPGRFRIEDIRAYYGGQHRNYFAFDESGGLRWKKKYVQQKKAYHAVLKTVYNYIFKKTIRAQHIPFWLWLFMKRYKEKRRHVVSWACKRLGTA